MSRPIHIEFPDALYHVTAREDRRGNIFDDDLDRQRFLATLRQVVTRFGWICYAWCLMDNHYHLLVQTPGGNLSRGIRQLDVVHTNPAIGDIGGWDICFGGASTLVDSDACLPELARYVVLNPVRAGMADNPVIGLPLMNCWRSLPISAVWHSSAMRKL